METKIKEIFEKNDKPIKSFRDLELTENDLNFISRVLEKYPNVSFINWEQNETVLNEHRDLKKTIQKILVSNLLSNKDNLLVIDLSDCSLDDDFIELLATEIENNFSIGGIIWGEQNEQKFKNNRSISKIEKHLSTNNAEYNRFPSDYIHCVMANHCRNGDDKMKDILEKDGWSIKEEMKQKSYAAILYENKSQKQLVLAFRGMKFEIKDLFVKESQLEGWFYEMMGSEVSYQTCNAYQHTRAAYDMSKELNYNLSFTGYSLGAWLAEQSAFFCYQEFGALDVRAVTFESPGSVEILEELGQSNVERFNLTAKDLGNKLDVKTYLLAPNFINTCNKHIGKVYRLYETSTPERRIKIIEDFTVNSFINAFPVKKVREKLTEWYKNKVKPYFSQYIFYLNGLRSLLSDDISWILNEFDSDKRIFKCEVREVMNWPHMKFEREHFDNLDFKIFDKLSNFIPLGQIVPSILKKPIDWAISAGIKSISKRCLSGFALVINLIAEIKEGNLNSSQCLKCFEYEENIFEHPDKTLMIFEGDFELKYKGKYRVRKFDPLYEQISEIHNHVDHKLVEFYFDINQIC